ncbi:hypothetical protein DFH08DRAFT_1083407 [Mycena albidolilacea]|uniref:Uncharacterized protein n=1 Tax=Mycena albidolilacea TaxID=1033008 RepID=A0AAD7EM93_9AGAR|nr:hypothetical protein DFH08DRAFT_1083407 [Mycena albidolilacea]
MGADSVISLPPPHELSRPVSVVADSEYTPGTNRAGGRRRTMSGVSAISTTFSQFDILSPPRAAEAPMSRSDQVAREWRVANADPPERRQGTTEESNSSENFSTRSSVPYSQASRRTGPRRPREIVMPMPLSTAMDTDGGMAYARPMASTSAAPLRDPYSTPAGPSSAPATAFTAAPPPNRSQEYVDETGSTPSRSALAWIKSRFNRSVSASTVPINIQIEPPSNPASNPSTDCTVNTILLTAETAGVETLPQQFVPELAGAVAGVQQLQHGDGNVIVLPDNELPRGFVPLSPILPSLYSAPVPVSVPVLAGDSSAASARPPAPSPTPSPQPPAYTPRDIYAARELPRPATAAGMTRARSPPHFEVEAAGSSRARARGASIGSAMLSSPAPLNRPISIFSEV